MVLSINILISYIFIVRIKCEDIALDFKNFISHYELYYTV